MSGSSTEWSGLGWAFRRAVRRIRSVAPAPDWATAYRRLVFAELALLVAAGLVGPLLAAGQRQLAPAVVGEIAAGAILGHTGLGIVDPASGALPMFSALGFAMLMLTAGTHVDPGSAAFRAGFPRAVLAVVVAIVLGLALGTALSAWLNIGPPGFLGILIAGSSAAIAFPIIEERRLTGPAIAFLTTWIALADAITVVAMPLTLVGSSKLAEAIAGDAAIVIATVVLLWLAEQSGEHRFTRRMIEESRERDWVLQLRLSIVLLFALAAIAETTGGSTLVAGFAAGIVLARLREPGRLALQIAGLATGFFVPLFFVLLGAALDLRGLIVEPGTIMLAIAMVLASVVAHLVAARIGRREDWQAAGLAASAQLGLPAAAASLGLATGAISGAAAAALVAGGCLTLLPAALGARLLTRRASEQRASEDRAAAEQAQADRAAEQRTDAERSAQMRAGAGDVPEESTPVSPATSIAAALPGSDGSDRTATPRG